jgi:hypothetical protein
MARNKEIPDLLAQYMEKCGEMERWITVYEFRTFFHLDESSAHAISGFLRRIHYRPFFSYQYRVKKIEKIMVCTPQPRCINRYLVKRRPEINEAYSLPCAGATAPGGQRTIGLPATVGVELCTDYDAVKIFNRVLHRQIGESEVRDTR